MKLLEKSDRKSTTTTESTKGGVYFDFFSFDCQHVKLSFNQNKPLASSRETENIFFSAIINNKTFHDQ